MRQQNIIRIASDAVQGPGSFVKAKPPKWGLIRKAQAGAKSDDKNAAGVDFAGNLLISTVVEWDWTDDNGNKLPLPSAVPEVVDDLTSAEVEFLVSAISGAFSNTEGN